MNTSMGHPDPPEGWLAACSEVYAKRLAQPDFLAVVVDGDLPGTLACSGAGWIDYHLPTYRDLTGRIGFIASMSTDVDARGRGYARLVLEQLLVWFRSQGITAVDLHASTFGEPLYRQYGFTEQKSKALSAAL